MSPNEDQYSERIVKLIAKHLEVSDKEYHFEKLEKEAFTVSIFLAASKHKIKANNTEETNNQFWVMEFINGNIPFEFPSQSLFSEIIDAGTKTKFTSHGVTKIKILKPDEKDTWLTLQFDFKSDTNYWDLFLVVFIDIDIINSHSANYQLNSQNIILEDLIKNGYKALNTEVKVPFNYFRS